MPTPEPNPTDAKPEGLSVITNPTRPRDIVGERAITRLSLTRPEREFADEISLAGEQRITDAGGAYLDDPHTQVRELSVVELLAMAAEEPPDARNYLVWAIEGLEALGPIASTGPARWETQRAIRHLAFAHHHIKKARALHAEDAA